MWRSYLANVVNIYDKPSLHMQTIPPSEWNAEWKRKSGVVVGSITNLWSTHMTSYLVIILILNFSEESDIFDQPGFDVFIIHELAKDIKFLPQKLVREIYLKKGVRNSVWETLSVWQRILKVTFVLSLFLLKLTRTQFFLGHSHYFPYIQIASSHHLLCIVWPYSLHIWNFWTLAILTVVFMIPVPCVRIELAMCLIFIVFKCLLLLILSTKICN